jgi:hypothetical protein
MSEEKTTTVELFSIKKIGEQIQITGESSPEDLASAFAVILSDSKVFRAIMATASELANDKEFLDCFNTEGRTEAIIRTQGDA